MLLLALATGAVGIGYMLFEAQWLRIRRVKLKPSGLPGSLNGLKLLHLSDLHAGAPGPGAMAVDKLVEASKRTRPDIVLFTGDMVDKKRDLRPHLDLLGRIEARYGKFAVLGNHDHGERKNVIRDLAGRLVGRTIDESVAKVSAGEVTQTVDLYRQLLAEAGITLLENECAIVEGEGWRVQVCGIDDMQYGHADLAGTEARVDPEVPLRILMSHNPDAANCVTEGKFQLLLAGHTHGGQICIPKPGGRILLSTSGAEFGEGLYHLHDLTMHVSRGVGTTFLPFRLFSRPEATLLEFDSDDAHS